MRQAGHPGLSLDLPSTSARFCRLPLDAAGHAIALSDAGEVPLSGATKPTRYQKFKNNLRQAKTTFQVRLARRSNRQANAHEETVAQSNAGRAHDHGDPIKHRFIGDKFVAGGWSATQAIRTNALKREAVEVGDLLVAWRARSGQRNDIVERSVQQLFDLIAQIGALHGSFPSGDSPEFLFANHSRAVYAAGRAATKQVDLLRRELAALRSLVQAEGETARVPGSCLAWLADCIDVPFSSAAGAAGPIADDSVIMAALQPFRDNIAAMNSGGTDE